MPKRRSEVSVKKKPTPFRERLATKPSRTIDEVKTELRELATRAGDQQFQIRCITALLESTNQRMLELNQEYAKILEATKAEEVPTPAPAPSEAPTTSEATH